MAKVSKTLAMGKYRYINILDIESDEEHEMLFQKIKKLVEESN